MSDAGYPGQADNHTPNSEFNALVFMIRQAMGEASHVAIVLVKAVTGGGVGAPPTVNVQPMVSQIDQAGTVTPHGVIYGLPVWRLMGGTNAIIMDPQVGDIGVALFADRDSSAALRSGAPAPPGSWRRFDWADGVYLGALGQITPTQFIEFTQAGITMTSPTKVIINAPEIDVNGNSTVNVNSPNVNLGGTGGPAVARVGDTVMVGASAGTITSGSAKVKAA